MKRIWFIVVWLFLFIAIFLVLTLSPFYYPFTSCLDGDSDDSPMVIDTAEGKERLSRSRIRNRGLPPTVLKYEFRSRSPKVVGPLALTGVGSYGEGSDPTPERKKEAFAKLKEYHQKKSNKVSTTTRITDDEGTTDKRQSASTDHEKDGLKVGGTDQKKTRRSRNRRLKRQASRISVDLIKVMTVWLPV